MIAAYPRSGRLQRLRLLGRQAIEGGFELVLSQLQLGHGCGAGAIKSVGVFDYGGVAAGFDIGQNRRNTLIHLRILRGFKSQ